MAGLLDTVVGKLSPFIKWLDGIPSVPAASGAFIVGLLVPKFVVWLVIILVIAYAGIKFLDK
jgi:hypothetical protein